MAFVVGENSYISITDASLYFDDRLYTEAWDELVIDSDKETALITAFNLLEISFDWLYSKTDSDQIQEFPRNDEIVVPIKIIHAQCEIALLLLRNKADLVKPHKEMKHSVLTIKTDKISIFSDTVLNLIRNYGREKDTLIQKQVHTIDVLR